MASIGLFAQSRARDSIYFYDTHCCMSDLGFGSHKDHKGHKDYGTMHLFVPFVAKLTSPYKSKCCRPDKPGRATAFACQFAFLDISLAGFTKDY